MLLFSLPPWLLAMLVRMCELQCSNPGNSLLFHLELQQQEICARDGRDHVTKLGKRSLKHMQEIITSCSYELHTKKTLKNHKRLLIFWYKLLASRQVLFC